MRTIIAVTGILSLAFLLPADMSLADERNEFRAELERDMARDAYQSILAGEEKEAEYQMAKTITDVHGNRVRMEGYVLKPSPEQYKLLALNTRDGRIDYGYYLYTFNDAVPGLDVLEEASAGMWEEKPNYWVRRVETKLSNMRDNVTTKQEISDPVEIDVSLFSEELVMEEAGEELELNIPEQIYLQTNYHYTRSVNGNVKEKVWSGFSPETGIAGYEAWYPASDGLALGEKYEYDVFNGQSLTMLYDTRVVPDYEYSADSDQAHWKDREDFKDGTFLSEETFLIDDEGNIQRWDIPEILDAGEIMGGNGEVELTKDGMKTLDEYGQVPNIERIITATEFEGRKIDLVYPTAVPEIGLDIEGLW
ncbi:MAG: hypothetical protein QME81_03555 [bacterium]|nr:hypothetical protein [bacterium]